MLEIFILHCERKLQMTLGRESLGEIPIFQLKNQDILYIIPSVMTLSDQNSIIRKHRDLD